MIIDGKKHAQDVLDRLKESIALSDIKPHLVVVLVGDDPASQVYVKNKVQKAKAIGMVSTLIELPNDVSQEQLLRTIEQLNLNKDVHGILVQLPLPKHIQTKVIQEAILPSKDVDGLHPLNVGYLVSNQEGLVSCTPQGIMTMLKKEGVNLIGQRVVVMGRSQIVGMPMAHLLIHEDATVTIVHSKTTNIKEITKQADILIVAIGQPKMIDDTYIKEGAIVIDVGIHRLESGLVGDCDFDKLKDKASMITPVPGGVGPMTIAMLLKNTYQAMMRRDTHGI